MSQAALAKAMSERGWPWHQQTAYKVENGKQGVSLGETTDLAEILGTTTDRFTWLPPEAAEAALVDRSTAILRQSAEEAANAIAALHAARAGAERTLAEHGDGKYRRVRQALDDLAAELEDATEGNVLAEGAIRWQQVKAGR